MKRFHHFFTMPEKNKPTTAPALLSGTQINTTLNLPNVFNCCLIYSKKQKLRIRHSYLNPFKPGFSFPSIFLKFYRLPTHRRSAHRGIFSIMHSYFKIEISARLYVNATLGTNGLTKTCSIVFCIQYYYAPHLKILTDCHSRTRCCV